MTATSKYLYRDSTSGQVQEAQPLSTSAGAGSSGLLAQLDSTGRFDASFMPVGVTADVYNANANGAISAGDLCYVDSGGLIARATGAVSGHPAIGFSLTAVTTGNPATIYFSGSNTAVSGLTQGSRYYLSDTTAGGIVSTPVTGSGKLHQYVGIALTATRLIFDRSEDAVVLA